jgi:FkbM family methyltransferase
MALVTSAPFVSYAQNGEDVVLWRALGHLAAGRYVDVGANSPTDDSVTKTFYDRGWSGLDVEPMTTYAAALREQRPRDTVVEAVVTESDEGEVVLHQVDGTGLSTLRDDYVRDHVEHGFSTCDLAVPTRRLDSLVAEHLDGEEVHFCKVDVEGGEAAVLRSVDLGTWRPWVLVVEATRPNSTESTHGEWEPLVTSAGYRFCLFDGLSRFYVADEHAELAPALSYPACVLDEFVPAAHLAVQAELRRLQQVHHETVQELERTHERLAGTSDLEREVAELRRELVHWRGAVLERWAGALAPAASPPADASAQAELEAMRRTVSWRVTRPLRAVRSLHMRSRP